ncbi:MAG: esterase family protein, partial [Ignavibacteriales bacterium]|nr:esterase family protein [Ignavibacteriales bacterium]
MKKLLSLFIITIFFNSFNYGLKNDLYSDPHRDSLFSSVADFNKYLDSLCNISNVNKRDSVINLFWSNLISHKQIPFVIGDTVVFLFKGSGLPIQWAGDFNGWDPNSTGWTGSKIGSTSVWRLIKSFPTDARLDYKIVKNTSDWILNPSNPYKQYSGFGPNSELRMPEWIYPIETIRDPAKPRGTLSNNILIASSNLNYDVNYKVYTPYQYDSLYNLPVIYVTDGHEYSNDLLGSMIIVLDNLIADKKIQPIIAVFIDPRDPYNSNNNRRETEYTMNESFANFVADELVPCIDSIYRTDTSADNRAILGTSLGGINSAYFGATRYDVFHLIGIHSPAFNYTPDIFSLYNLSEDLPCKFFMSTGVINDTEEAARYMESTFHEKDYEYLYIEVNEGHSWGNWRALLDEPLIYFFADSSFSEIELNN